ncbi:DegT/DnrJ/EryC1/StrS family aminotransferase [Planococcus beigongshangi]|uniref:DegT/DnrJ/EryC1/StrS family aminotransferase n=1 Tax=Planococcus beigongshangi TaxID=2782536 RepID=UPI00193B335A|nr:DegT/DnrJ/EryC1/StrS family aminotransferase [Planococcus beigongshangi]
MTREIGSEFWLENMPENSICNSPNFLGEYKNINLTSSGRGAITLLLQQIKPKRKSALLPAYICESVIIPFIEMCYECNYYEVDENLIPSIKSISEFKDVGVFLHLGYYGFSTNSNLKNVLKSFDENSTIIIEDVTHSLFSDYERSKFNHFYIGSIRKWFGIPSGGFLASKGTLSSKLDEKPSFSEKRLEALISKKDYIETGNIELKSRALSQFSEAENNLDEDFYPYKIDSLSYEIINTINEEELIRKRRQNYLILYNGLKEIPYLHHPSLPLDENTCPMFFPVLIEKEYRTVVRGKLAEQGIYCPIHWPVPPQINTDIMDTTKSIYDRILSIPCDQRYGEEDMERIVTVLKCIC